MTTATLPDTIHAIHLIREYDCKPIRIVAAADNPDRLDGVSLKNRKGYGYSIRSHEKPRSIATLEADFGDRVRFGRCQNGLDVGCWIDGRPHRLDVHYHPSPNVGEQGALDYAEWTWSTEERDYIEALIQLFPETA